MILSTLKQLRSVPFSQWMILCLIGAIIVGIFKFYGIGDAEWIVVQMQLSAKPWESVSGRYPVLPLVPHWVVDPINQGDVEYSPNGTPMATIERIQSLDHINSSVMALVTVRLRGYRNLKTRTFMFRNTPITVGSFIQISPNSHTLSGQIIGIGDNLPESSVVTKPITLRVRNVDPWVIESLKNHPQVLDTNSHQPALKINSVTIEPHADLSYPITYNEETNLEYVTINPLAKDIVIQGDIGIESRSSHWYFAGMQPIKVGGTIVFSTPESGPFYAEVQAIQLQP